MSSFYLHTASMLGGRRLWAVLQKVHECDLSHDPKNILDRSLVVWEKERENLEKFYLKNFEDTSVTPNPFTNAICTGQERLLGDCNKNTCLSHESKEYLCSLNKILEDEDKNLSLIILFYLDFIEYTFLEKLGDELKTQITKAEKLGKQISRKNAFLATDFGKHKNFFEARNKSIDETLPSTCIFKNEITKKEIKEIFIIVRLKLASIKSFTE